MKRTRILITILFLCPPSVSAQKPEQDSARLDFSGIFFANYQYRGESAAGSANKFDVERAYLTFRMPAGERASIRVTTDLYQQTSTGSDAYYRGWSVRAKYAYLQYAYLNGKEWRASARLGLLQTVFIEHDESFWPRWIANSPTERAGFFSSADAGLSNTITLPAGLGEIYSTLTNGPGYTSREVDRFKDFGTRVTLKPLAGNRSSPFRTLALSAWGYKGSTASRFVNGGTGQVGSVGDGLDRDRWGLHAGLAHPRVTAAAQYAVRSEEGEEGLNTSASPRTVIDSSGSVLSGYAMVRPLQPRGSLPHPLSILVRVDRVTTNDLTDAAYDFVIGGLIWDLSSKLSVSLDYQETSRRRGATVAPAKTWFAHVVARF